MIIIDLAKEMPAVLDALDRDEIRDEVWDWIEANLGADVEFKDRLLKFFEKYEADWFREIWGEQ